MAVRIVSAASMPDFMAVWMPFSRCTFSMEALSPTNSAPSTASCGIVYSPPADSVLAPC